MHYQRSDFFFPHSLYQCSQLMSQSLSRTFILLSKYLFVETLAVCWSCSDVFCHLINQEASKCYYLYLRMTYNPAGEVCHILKQFPFHHILQGIKPGRIQMVSKCYRLSMQLQRKLDLFLTTELFHIDQKLIIRSNILYDC